MKQSLIDKIKFLTEMTTWDHHKTRDGYYSIEAIYNVWENKVWYVPVHDGYLWEVKHTEWETYERAEKELERQVDKKIQDEFEWAEKNLTNVSAHGWDFMTPLDTEENIEKYKQEYNKLRGTN